MITFCVLKNTRQILPELKEEVITYYQSRPTSTKKAVAHSDYFFWAEWDPGMPFFFSSPQTGIQKNFFVLSQVFLPSV